MIDDAGVLITTGTPFVEPDLVTGDSFASLTEGPATVVTHSANTLHSTTHHVFANIVHRVNTLHSTTHHVFANIGHVADTLHVTARLAKRKTLALRTKLRQSGAAPTAHANALHARLHIGAEFAVLDRFVDDFYSGVGHSAPEENALLPDYYDGITALTLHVRSHLIGAARGHQASTPSVRAHLVSAGGVRSVGDFYFGLATDDPDPLNGTEATTMLSWLPEYAA